MWLLPTSPSPHLCQQKRHRAHRDTLMENASEYLRARIKDEPLQAVNLRAGFQMELFRLALKEVGSFSLQIRLT